jgi:hypothetical protein
VFEKILKHQPNQDAYSKPNVCGSKLLYTGRGQCSSGDFGLKMPTIYYKAFAMIIHLVHYEHTTIAMSELDASL